MPANHLIQRGTTWHCRLDVPIDLRAHYGNRRILSKSLRTGDKILARELASRLTAQWKAEFRAIRDQKLMRGEEWREQAFALSTSVEQMLQKRALEVMGVKEYIPPTPEQTAELEAQCITLPPDTKVTPAGPMFSFDLRGKAPAEQVAELQRLAQSIRDTEHDVVLNQFSLDKDQRQELKAILSSSASYKPKSPISRSAIESFRKYQEGQTENIRTIAVLISKLEALSAYLSKEGKPLTFDTVADYLDTISDKRQTRQGHLWAMRKFHKWACRYHQPYRDQFAALPNPFAEHTHARVGKAGGESWTPYTPTEVAQLHTAALSKNDQDLADLIKFACYTGCRIEEIGRISISTTIFENDQPVAFRVEDSKTESGIRTIPIHPDLLPLYQQRIATTQEGYLFAGKQDKAGKRLNAVQQRFTKLKREQQFTDLHVFHSFRGTFITQLEQAGATPLAITSIVGHKRGSITFDVYSAGASFAQKVEAISKLSFNF